MSGGTVLAENLMDCMTGKSALDIELQVNILAKQSRDNFDRYWGDRTAGLINEFQVRKDRLAITEPIDHPTITVDVSAAKFDFTKINELVDAEIKTRVVNGKSIEAQRPISVKFKGVDYSNIAKIVANLKDNTVIEKLILNSAKLEADDAKEVATMLEKNTSITTLDLSANTIGAEGVSFLTASLAKNTTLTDLDLGVNELGKTAMKPFADFLRSPQCALKRILLAGNKLGIYGMEELAAGLRGNATVESIGLFNNGLGADGLKIVSQLLTAEEKGQPPNQTLMHISLGGNKADESEYVKVIENALKLNSDVAIQKTMVKVEAEARAALEAEADKVLSWQVPLMAQAKKELEEKLASKKAAPPGKAAPGKGAAGKTAPAAKAPAKAPAGSKAVKAAAAAPGKRAPSPKKSGK